MKVLLKFKSGKRHAGDTLALVLPENPNDIIETIELTASDEDFEKLKANPFDEKLIAKLKKK